MNKILHADSAGSTFQKLYERTHLTLAALIPLSGFSTDGSTLQKVSDYGLAIAIPVHSHVALNSVVSDYVPRSFQGPTRWSVLALSTITLAGLLKLNATGPGITPTIKSLWKRKD